MILAIDPGTTHSGVVLYNEGTASVRLAESAVANAAVLARIGTYVCPSLIVVCEMVQNYGTPVGWDVFETLCWVGRFEQFTLDRGGRFDRSLTRPNIKTHLCNSARADDPSVRQSIINRFGSDSIRLHRSAAPCPRCFASAGAPCIGRKGPIQGIHVERPATKGALYDVSSHAWSALALALTFADTRLQRVA